MVYIIILNASVFFKAMHLFDGTIFFDVSLSLTYILRGVLHGFIIVVGDHNRCPAPYSIGGQGACPQAEQGEQDGQEKGRRGRLRRQAARYLQKGI